MNFKMLFVSLLCLGAIGRLSAIDVDTALLRKNLQKHVYYLASDKLAGRLTGSKGEKLAGAYIAGKFKSFGLKPAGDGKTYFQTFSFHTGYRYGEHNEFTLDNTARVLDKDFYPIAYSGNGKVSGKVINLRYAIRSKENNRDDFKALLSDDNPQHFQDLYANKVLLIDLSLPDGNSPHSKFAAWSSWRTRFDSSKFLKPIAILFYNSPDTMSVQAYRKYQNLQQADIPILMISNELAEKIKSEGMAQVSLQVDLKKEEVKGRNVLGYLARYDSTAPHAGPAYTIVIGAHYDHLGRGEFGNSLYTGKEPLIHNGADDNASGSASLIELARLISKDKSLNHYNYLFIAFSGEEEGLLGSNYFTKHSFIPADHFDCMINMDMVGRLNAAKELGINGTGTSPAWDSIIKPLDKEHFAIKTTESGMGASDHTSFYLQNVPALHFFSGNEPDYHKPSDDADKINYTGMRDITDFIYDVICRLDKHPKLIFTKTRDESASTPHFKVTLGIIPDYFFEGPGIRIDGISSGKTAEKAGLKPGDIIRKLGPYDVKDMQSYMETLGKFSKGDKIEVEILRGKDTMKFPVQF